MNFFLKNGGEKIQVFHNQFFETKFGFLKNKYLSQVLVVASFTTDHTHAQFQNFPMYILVSVCLECKKNYPGKAKISSMARGCENFSR